MVYSIFKFRTFVRDTGIKYVFNALLDQPAYMTMGQLGRITFRLTGNGLNAKLINFFCRGRR